MAKFATATRLVGPITTTAPGQVTYEGAPAYSRDAKSDLFLLAVTNMVREDTFYEKAAERDNRFRHLIHQVTVEDQDWMRRFIPWLRNTAQMRSASVVALAEYVKAGGKMGRSLIAGTLARADEPAELLAYWHQAYGRKLPAPIKRGVADASIRLFNERAALKYDGSDKAWRLADVIELTHPKPSAEWQAQLFRYLLNKRHGRITEPVPETLRMISAFEALTEKTRADVLANPELLTAAGMTWERLSSYGPMDKEAWEAVIPSMGYMALLRNLRNFDQAGISGPVQAYVMSKLADQEEVAKSRQFPFRFWSAYRELGSLHWGPAIEQALDYATSNIPEFPGRTLVLFDDSGSMVTPLSGRGTVQRCEVGALFAAALTKRGETVTAVKFSDHADVMGWNAGWSVLRMLAPLQYRGGGTYTMQALQFGLQHMPNPDRIVVFTDEQSHEQIRNTGHRTFWFNLAGYSPAVVPSEGEHYEMGGFTDSTFTIMRILETHRSAGWPF